MSIHLKIDVAIRQSVDTAFIQEVDILYEQAEERNNNLKDKNSEFIINSHAILKLQLNFCNYCN